MARTKKRVPPVITKILKAVEGMSPDEASEALQAAAAEEDSVESRVLLLQARVKLLQDAMKPKRPPRKRKRKPKPPPVEEVAETPAPEPEPEPEENTGTVTALDLDNLGALFGAVERGGNEAEAAAQEEAQEKPAKPDPSAAMDFGELDALMSSDDATAPAAPKASDTPAEIDFGGLDDLMADDTDTAAPAANKGGDDTDPPAAAAPGGAPDPEAPATPEDATEMPDLSALNDLDYRGASQDEDGADLSALMASMNEPDRSGAAETEDAALPDLSALQDLSDGSNDDDDGSDDDWSAFMGALAGGEPEAAKSEAAGETGAESPQTPPPQSEPAAETAKDNTKHSAVIPDLSAPRDQRAEAEADTTGADDLSALMGALNEDGNAEPPQADDAATGAADPADQEDAEPAPASAALAQAPDIQAAPVTPGDGAGDDAFDMDEFAALMGSFDTTPPDSSAPDAAEPSKQPSGLAAETETADPAPGEPPAAEAPDTVDPSTLLGADDMTQPAADDEAPPRDQPAASDDLSDLMAAFADDPAEAAESEDAPGDAPVSLGEDPMTASQPDATGTAQDDGLAGNEDRDDALNGMLAALSGDGDAAAGVPADDQASPADTGASQEDGADLSALMQALSEPEPPTAPDTPTPAPDPQENAPRAEDETGSDDPGTPDYSEFEALMGATQEADTGATPPARAEPEQDDAETAAAPEDIPAETADGTATEATTPDAAEDLGPETAPAPQPPEDAPQAEDQAGAADPGTPDYSEFEALTGATQEEDPGAEDNGAMAPAGAEAEQDDAETAAALPEDGPVEADDATAAATPDAPEDSEGPTAEDAPGGPEDAPRAEDETGSDDPETPDYSEFEALMGATQEADPGAADTGAAETEPGPDPAGIAEPIEGVTGSVESDGPSADEQDFSEFNALMAGADPGPQTPGTIAPLPEPETPDAEEAPRAAEPAAPLPETQTPGDEGEIALRTAQPEDCSEDDAKQDAGSAPPDTHQGSAGSLTESAIEKETPDPSSLSEMQDAPADSDAIAPDRAAPAQVQPVAEFAAGKKKATLDDLYNLFPKAGE